VATAFEGFATGAVTTAGTAAEKRAAFGKATARAGGVTTLFWCARPITDSAARGIVTFYPVCASAARGITSGHAGQGVKAGEACCSGYLW
jgi:hypothetical protein